MPHSGLNKSTISRQIRDGKIPAHDGLLDPKEADCAREKNLSPARRERAARRKETVKRPAVARREAPGVAVSDDPVYAERLRVLRRIVSPDQQLEFAQVAVNMGCSREQAFALACQFSCQPACVIDLADADLESLANFPSPAASEWEAALGPFDIEAAETLHSKFS